MQRREQHLLKENEHKFFKKDSPSFWTSNATDVLNKADLLMLGRSTENTMDSSTQVAMLLSGHMQDAEDMQEHDQGKSAQ